MRIEDKEFELNGESFMCSFEVGGNYVPAEADTETTPGYSAHYEDIEVRDLVAEGCDEHGNIFKANEEQAKALEAEIINHYDNNPDELEEEADYE